MELLHQYFKDIGFDNDECTHILRFFENKILQKDDYFVEEGKVATQLGYIASGQLRYYSISSDGEEHTTYVSIEKNFVTSLLSYLKEVPAIESIRAISPAQLWFIEKANVERLIQDIPKFKDFYIKVIEYQICCIDQSRLELITLTAEQRYARVLKENPELLQKVPLQYLASILGITPRHLSRIRKSAF